ncbi:hypothetical protein AAMO2058_001301500 [Amorphochlora amoebiformis]
MILLTLSTILLPPPQISHSTSPPPLHRLRSRTRAQLRSQKRAVTCYVAHGSSRFVRRVQEQAFEDLKKAVPSVVSRGAPEGIQGKDRNMPIIIASVSGGSDSIALIDILHNIRCRVNVALDLHVIHFDHQLRGLESDGDREYVHHICRDIYNIPPSSLHTRYWCLESNPPKTSIGVQEKAREWRTFESEALVNKLQQESEGRSDVVVALGHHADDSVETILLKLLRGASITSLKGIDLKLTNKGLTKIRPLLSLSKAELQRYLNERNVSWREDSSNQKLKYNRNKIRNIVIPALAEVAGSPKALADRFGELDSEVRSLGDYVESELKSTHVEETADFIVRKEAAEFLERERLYRFVRRAKKGQTVTYKGIHEIWRQIDSAHAKLVDLKDDFFARVQKGRVSIITRSEKNQLDEIAK